MGKEIAKENCRRDESRQISLPRSQDTDTDSLHGVKLAPQHEHRILGAH